MSAQFRLLKQVSRRKKKTNKQTRLFFLFTPLFIYVWFNFFLSRLFSITSSLMHLRVLGKNWIDAFYIFKWLFLLKKLILLKYIIFLEVELCRFFFFFLRKYINTKYLTKLFKPIDVVFLFYFRELDMVDW